MNRSEVTQAIHDRIDAITSTVFNKYALDLSKIEVTFKLRGKTAGKASARKLWFNVEIATLNFDEFIRNVIPHEIAHTVCFLRTALGENHDLGWRRICLALGGSGTTTHEMKANYANGSFLYLASCGTEVELSKVRHNRIQLGKNIRVRKTHGRITAACWIRSGRSGDLPVNPPTYARGRAPVTTASDNMLDIIAGWDSPLQMVQVHNILKINGTKLISAVDNMVTLTNGWRTVSISSNGQREYV